MALNVRWRNKRRARPLRLQLLTLSFVLFLPTLLFVGVLLWEYASSERIREEEVARALSRNMAVTLDREIVGVLTTLQALATSPSLQTGDLPGFYSQISEIRRLQGIHISLRDVDGHTVMTTRAPLGTFVPVPELLAEADQEIMKSGVATVSDIFRSATSKDPVFQIVAAPIPVAGKPTYLLAASMDLNYLADAIRGDNLPQGWVGALVDRRGIFAARTNDQHDFAGTPTSPLFQERALGDAGSYYGPNTHGQNVLVGYARSKLTGWVAGASIPADLVDAPRRRSLLILVGLGLLLGTMATMAALLFGRRLGRSMHRLGTAAEAIGRGDLVEPFETPIAEVNRVGTAMVHAAEQLHARARERDVAEATMRELADSLEAQVASRTATLMATEDNLRQAQKMEAVGQLTGGIAHDFNNLLTGISGSLELIQLRLNQGRPAGLERYLGAAQGAARRAATLVHRLLAFSRRQTLDPKPTDINRLIAGMEELIRRTIGPTIQLEVVGAVGLWPTLVDASQLENALLNLCINARDAMPSGGRITVETANKWIDERTAKERDLAEGQYLALCVTDTGTGMTPDVMAKAFEPFFTTKPLGHGTGLGLSMIHGFTRQSGGQVRIYSEPGQGSTICLYLPRHYGNSVDEPVSRPPVTPAPHGRGETVLIVDDEPTIRMLVIEVLEELGYTAIEAPDGPTALKQLQSDQAIALLITDVGLPGGLNGRQLADAARLTRPELKVLFITGYAENALIGNGHLEPGMDVMTKPFALEHLTTKIGEMIGNR